MQVQSVRLSRSVGTGLGIVYGGAHSLLNAIDDTPHQCPNHTPVIGLESIY